jgi:hypothetical protein
MALAFSHALGCPSRRSFLRLATTGVGCWLASTSGPARSDEPRPRAPGGRLLLLSRRGPRPDLEGGFVYDLKAARWYRITLADPQDGRLSRDGSTLAYNETELSTCPTAAGTDPRRIATEPKRISKHTGFLAWSPDSRQLMVSSPSNSLKPPHETWLMNVNGSDSKRLPIPETHYVVDWSSDGEWLLTGSRPNQVGKGPTAIAIMHPDGTGVRQVVEGCGLSECSIYRR